MLFFYLPQVVCRREFDDQNQHHAIDPEGAKHIQFIFIGCLISTTGCSVATAGSPTSNEVTDYLNEILIALGANAVGQAGASPNIPGQIETAEKEAFSLGQELVEAMQTKKVYPDQEAIHKERDENS
jgi:hypothetical protein